MRHHAAAASSAAPTVAATAATAVAALTAGVTAAVVLRRRAGRRLAVEAMAPAAALPPVVPVPVQDGVVLSFVRPVLAGSTSDRPVRPARCGDSGGQTKAGVPCAARAAAGRCHHHQVAA